MARTDTQPWTCECHGNVAVWDVTGWDAIDAERIDETLGTLQEILEREAITASITVLGPDPALDSGLQRFIGRQRRCYWCGDLDKVGFVSATLEELSTAAWVTDAAGIEATPFDDLETAFGWARE